MALVTKAEVKDYLKLDPNSTVEDAMLDHLIAAAQAEMEVAHGRALEYSDTDRVEIYSGNGEKELFLRAYPVVSVTQVKLNGNVLPNTAYEVNRSLGVLIGTWECGVDNIEVSYKAGYWTGSGQPPAGVERLPSDLKHECLERVAYLYENRRGRR